MKTPIYELNLWRKRPLRETTRESLERQAEEQRTQEKPVNADNRRIAWERSLRKAA